MLAVLSPAKALDLTPSPFDFDDGPLSPTFPVLVDDIEALMATTKKLSQRKIKDLMHLSDDLAKLNFDRYHAFSLPLTADNARPCVFMFNGEVYRGLDARRLSEDDVAYAQDHLAILSGLYGLLRPLDRIQAYRLEMGTKLQTIRGASLYAFWGARISETINAALESHAERALINLASTEYFKAVKLKALDAPVVTCVFEDWKAHEDEGKVISFMAKQARGMMARFIVQDRVDRIEGLKDFGAGRYRFRPDRSTNDTFVFSRQCIPVKDLRAAKK